METLATAKEGLKGNTLRLGAGPNEAGFSVEVTPQKLVDLKRFDFSSGESSDEAEQEAPAEVEPLVGRFQGLSTEAPQEVVPMETSVGVGESVGPEVSEEAMDTSESTAAPQEMGVEAKEAAIPVPESVLASTEREKAETMHQVKRMVVNAGHFKVLKDGYKCLSCNFFTRSCDFFQLHLSGHLHGTSVACDHAPEHIVVNHMSHCIALDAVMEYMVEMMKKQGKDVKRLPLLPCNRRKRFSIYTHHQQQFSRHRSILMRLMRSRPRVWRIVKTPIAVSLQKATGQQNGHSNEEGQLEGKRNRTTTEDDSSSAMEEDSNTTSGEFLCIQ
jgi:hypothetical protein